MTTYEQLLGAVSANPEDDATKLSLASYLRTQDPESARFIELQIEWARNSPRRGPATRIEGIFVQSESAQIERAIGRPLSRDDLVPVESIDALTVQQVEVVRTLAQRQLVAALDYMRASSQDRPARGDAPPPCGRRGRRDN
jgi:uncharacterized protein (TIGR02996 family)